MFEKRYSKLELCFYHLKQFHLLLLSFFLQILSCLKEKISTVFQKALLSVTFLRQGYYSTAFFFVLTKRHNSSFALFTYSYFHRFYFLRTDFEAQFFSLSLSKKNCKRMLLIGRCNLFQKYLWKYLKSRSILCCYILKQYLTILLLNRPYKQCMQWGWIKTTQFTLI